MVIHMAKKEKETKVKITWKEIKRQKFLLICSALFVIYGIMFYYLPLGGWIMAFQNYKPKDGLLHSAFVGLDKFKFLFTDAVFLRVIRNTLAMGVLNLVTSFIMAIVFAILLNEILMKLHLINTEINFFAHQKYFWPIVAFANLWKETGWNAIIYLAAITAIDPCLYEAASIDGAGRWAKIRYITLPGIKSTIMILLLMNVGNVLNAGFEVQYLLGNGLVQKVSQTIDIYVLKWGISQGDFAIGTAAGIFKSFVSIILIVIANQIAKRNGEEQLF